MVDCWRSLLCLYSSGVQIFMISIVKPFFILQFGFSGRANTRWQQSSDSEAVNSQSAKIHQSNSRSVFMCLRVLSLPMSDRTRRRCTQICSSWLPG